jgi:hypothetical protein
MHMLRYLLFAFVTLVVVNVLGTEARAAASCPPGRITCTQWCAKYRPNPSDHCMSGARGSCEQIGFNRCVGGGAPHLITCEAWCYRYRGGNESCLATDPLSCMKHYGSLKHMVVDRPPR